MVGKSVIAVAHRVKTIARLDRIMVLDQRQIVEGGNHSELLERNGLYGSFWSRISGGFIDTENQEAAK